MSNPILTVMRSMITRATSPASRLLLIAVISGIPHPAIAECTGLPLAVRAQSATVVFSGTVIRLTPTEAPEWARGRAQSVTFAVERIWKGDVPKEFDLYSFTRSPEHYALRIGGRYLVFAHAATQEERVDLHLDQREAFVIGQCGDGTTEFPISAEELAALGPGISSGARD